MDHAYRQVVTSICLLVAVALPGTLVAAAPQGGNATSDWPQWRGPDRSSVTPESSGFPNGWPPKRLWETNVGKGCTSPIIVAGRLYVMGWGGTRTGANPAGTDTVYCFDAPSGRELWKQGYASSYQCSNRTGDTAQYGGPLSTPTFDGQTGLLYTLSVDGDLRCWDTTRDGRQVWAKNLRLGYNVGRRPDVGRGARDYGFTSSPLVCGDAVIVEVGSRQGTVMAFDKKTGARRWASVLSGPAGHSSGPTLIRLGGRNGILTLTLTRLAVVGIEKADQGRTIAEFERRTDFGCSIATPAVADGKVVLTSNYNQNNTTLLEFSNGRPGTIWTSSHCALVSSPVIHKDCVFIIDQSLKCLDLATGRLKWRGGSFGHGSCIVTAGDDKIIAFGQGRLVLLEARAGNNEYRELSRLAVVVPGTCYPHVAFADGLICCKDKDGQLVVLSVRAGRVSATR